VQHELGVDQKGQLVLEPAKHLERETLGLLRWRSIAPEPHSLGVALRLRHALPSHAELQECDASRHEQRLGQALPFKPTLERVLPRVQSDDRRAALLEHHRRAAIDVDALRPLLVAARQRHARAPIDLNSQTKAPAALVQLEIQPSRPHAHGTRGDGRTHAVAELLEYPGQPGPKRLWNLPGLERRGRRPPGHPERTRQQDGQPASRSLAQGTEPSLLEHPKDVTRRSEAMNHRR
jgi:hypothetical protein